MAKGNCRFLGIATLIFFILLAVNATASKKGKQTPFIVEVNGVKLTKAQLDADLKKKTNLLKAQLPADQLKKVRSQLKKRVIDDFVIKTLLSQEIKRLKIGVTEQEVNEAIARVKSGLQPNLTFEELLKKNGLTSEKFREEISLGVKVDKLVLSQPLAKAKPADKEITKFYEANKDKFKTPQAVHARHILIAKNAGDDEKTKTEKKAKAEALRKQLLEGADFAELATNNSDCPSKKSGGDLGTFPRGQMVKSFEDAAFAQKIKDIGPVVESNFGYHIIQVLEHIAPKNLSLDKKIKDEIGMYLQQQKRQEAFTELLKALRAKAKIISTEP